MMTKNIMFGALMLGAKSATDRSPCNAGYKFQPYTSPKGTFMGGRVTLPLTGPGFTWLDADVRREVYFHEDSIPKPLSMQGSQNVGVYMGVVSDPDDDSYEEDARNWVAIKLIQPKFLDNLRREIAMSEIIARSGDNFTNVGRVLGWGEIESAGRGGEKLYYTVSNLRRSPEQERDGHDTQDSSVKFHKDRIKKFNAWERDSILYQVCDILVNLWKNGIVHGDLTWENIVVDENCNVSLLDFGNSLLFGTNAEENNEYRYDIATQRNDIISLMTLMKDLGSRTAGLLMITDENEKCDYQRAVYDDDVNECAKIMNGYLENVQNLHPEKWIAHVIAHMPGYHKHRTETGQRVDFFTSAAQAQENLQRRLLGYDQKVSSPSRY